MTRQGRLRRVRLTVLANSQRYLAALGTGISYVVEVGASAPAVDPAHAAHVGGRGARIVVDAASGTAQALASRPPPDAVVITHFHADTVLDLVPAVARLPEGGLLFLPEGTRKRFEQLLDALQVPERRLAHVNVLERAVGGEARLADAWLRWGPADHGCPGASLRIEADGRVLVLAGETGPARGLSVFAHGADALVAHTFLLDGEDAEAARTNLTAGDAGRLAKAAGAKRLLLAHVPFYASADAAAREAQAAFGKAVTTLAEGAVVDLEG